MKENKKHKQLGMNPSTASGRLVKDILWSLLIETNKHICCKCNKEMTRETYSIEHIKPWLDSDDPIGLYFNLDNISFSHLSCNVSDRRITNKIVNSEEERKARNLQLEKDRWKRLSKEEQQSKRRNKYLKYGC